MALNKSESKYFNTARKMDKALISLLEERSFEYITVSEICKRSGVNRSTFYLHYENTVDLLNETARLMLEDFKSYFDIDAKTGAILKYEEDLDDDQYDDYDDDNDGDDDDFED